VAVVGEASIIVRAITSGVRGDIDRAFDGAASSGKKAGKSASDGFRSGFGDGGGSAFDNFRAKAEASRQELRRLSNIGRVLAPAIAGLVGIIGAAANGLVIFGAAVGNAARTSIVLLASLVALAQGALTAKLAFQGVGNAISAGLKAQEDGTGAANNQTAALKRLRDARLALKRLIEEEAPQILAEARERAAEAADRAADAVLNAERTQRSYNNAQKETFDALNDLNAARDRAREKIQQLRFELEGGAISEKKARLEFEKARDSLQAVQDLPPNSRARQEAELAFAQAELNLRKAIDSNSDLKKEEAAATQAGVEGSKDVVDAKERIANASQAEADAAIAASKALREAAKATLEAQRAAQAAAAGGSVERDLNRRIAEARDAVKEAEAALKQGAGAVDAYRKALEKLSPEARRFVEFITDPKIQDSFKALRFAAGRKLFGPLEEAIQNLVDNLFPTLEPLLEGTGGVLGEVAKQFSATITEAGNIQRLEKVWKTNDGLLKNFGEAASNLYTGLLLLLDAAEPLITAFGEWASAASGAWVETLKSKDATGELTEGFLQAQGLFSTIASIFGNLKDAFGSIGEAINGPGGAGPALLGFLDIVTGQFASDMDSALKDGSLQQFFLDAGENFQKLLTFLGALGAAILRFAATPGVGQLLDSLTTAVGYFADIGPALGAEDGPVAALGVFIEEFSRFVANLLEGGGITAFFDTLSDALTFINDILENETVQAFLEMVAPIIGAAAAVGVLFRTFKFFGEAVSGYMMLVPNFFAGAQKAFAGLQFNFQNLLFKFGMPLKFAMAGPLLGIIAGIAGFIALLVLAYQNSEDFRQSLKDFVDIIMSAVGPAIQGIKDAFAEIAPQLEETGGFFKKIGEIIGNVLAPIVRVLGVVFAGVVGYIGGLIRGLILIFGGIVKYISGVIDIIKGIFAFLSGDTEKAKELIGSGIDKIKEAFGMLWRGIMAPFEGLRDGLINGFNTLVEKFKEVPGKIAEFGANMWQFILDAFSAIWEGIQAAWDFYLEWILGWPLKLIEYGPQLWGWITAGFEAIWQGIQAAWDFYLEWIIGWPLKLAEYGPQMWAWITDWFSDMWTKLQMLWTVAVGYVRALPQRLKQIGMKIWDWVKDKFAEIWEGIQAAFAWYVDWITGWPMKLAELGKKLWSWITDYFSASWEALKILWENVVNFVKDIPDRMKRGAMRIWGWIRELWDEYWAAQKEALDVLVNWFGTLGEKLKAAGAKMWDWLGELWDDYWALQQQEWNKMVDFVKSIPGRLKDVGKSMWNWLKDTFKDALNWVIDRWNNWKLEVRIPDNWMTRGLGLNGRGFTIETPNIPRLAMGGIVSPRSGGTLAMIAEAGRPERVEPLDPDGLSKRDKAMIARLSGGGATINVYPSPGMDERELAEMVSRKLAYQMRKGSV